MEGKLAADSMKSLWTCVSIIYLLTPPIDSVPATERGDGVKAENYGVLLDAGSTSTKLNIYKWAPPTANHDVPYIDLIKGTRLNPGLDTYENDLDALGLYLDTILTTARNVIPSTEHARTPIYLMASAGLRLLSIQDARKLMEGTRLVLSTNKTINPFMLPPFGVSIISGEEEGVYAWLAVNYLLGFFNEDRPVNESVGVLEMGGGSTQITFIPDDPLLSEEFQVTVAGRKYELYAQSYLNYGSNAIKDRVAYLLSQRFPGQSQVDNPCMLRDDTVVMRLDDGRSLTMTGVGSPGACVQILQEILRPYTGRLCQPKPCAIGPVYQPRIPNIQFYATQSFTYAPRTLKAIGADEVLHIPMLEDAAFKHCNRTLQEALDSGMSKAFASDDCLMGLYIPTLLTGSYGFSRDTTKIKLTSRIDRHKLDWTLGAMLMQLSASFSTSKGDYSVTCKTPGLEGATVGYVKGRNSANPMKLSWILTVLTLPLLCWLS